MKRTILMALVMAVTAGFSLGACNTTHPHGCPPGQAKKGNCMHHHMPH